MKKTTAVLTLSLACATVLFAEQAEIGVIDVEAGVDSEVVKDVHGEDIKSADVSEALFEQSPSVWLVRRSAIANDIIVRGMKKDNVNVTIDGMKLYGACPNRMDSPVAHVFTNNVDYIVLDKGPFGVEDFGILTSDVKIETIEPEQGFGGDIDLGAGSRGYRKAAMSLHGGNDTIKFLISASTESAEQYEDGDGRDFVGQIQREIDAGKVPVKVQYQDRYKDLDAYSKNTFMGKLYWNIDDNQQLRLSYTANRGDDILYPSSKMDALYDDSDLYNIEYTVRNLGRYSDKLDVQLYRTEVDHSMGTNYRVMGDPNYMTHVLTTQVDGARIKNELKLGAHTVRIGADYMLRNWDGKYYMNDIPLDQASGGMKPYHSIYDVDTENIGVYIDDTVAMGMWTIDWGLRFDTTDISSGYATQQDNDYDALTGYVTATQQVNDTFKWYVGYGHASRVPDAKELYWFGSMGNEIGTPDLDNTLNDEIDIGLEKRFASGTVRAKAFYSMLTDFIAYNADNTVTMMGKPVAYHAYENVDATVWGLEVTGSWAMNDVLYFDYGLTYQKGEKDRPLTGQTGTDMPEIPPLKFNGAINYMPYDSLLLRAEVIAADDWSDYDAENGEQPIDGFAVLNLKATQQFAHGFELTVGVDNVFDKAYAVTNTYKDLILLPTVSPDDNVILMNEPGRYVYANLKYKF
jgi:iron complex outermembrane receptor protein